MEIRKGLEIRYVKGLYGYYSTYYLNDVQIPESMVSAILHKEREIKKIRKQIK